MRNILDSIIPPVSVVLADIPDGVLDYAEPRGALLDALQAGRYDIAAAILRDALARMPDAPARAIYLPDGRAIRAS